MRLTIEYFDHGEPWRVTPAGQTNAASAYSGAWLMPDGSTIDVCGPNGPTCAALLRREREAWGARACAHAAASRSADGRLCYDCQQWVFEAAATAGENGDAI